MVHRIVWRVASEDALDFWEARLRDEGVETERAPGRLRFDFNHFDALGRSRVADISAELQDRVLIDDGVRAIVLALMGAEVTALDVNARYIPAARANAARHGVAERIHFARIDGQRLPRFKADIGIKNGVIAEIGHNHQGSLEKARELVNLLTTWQQHSRFDVDERRRHHQELARDVEVHLLHQVDVFEVLLRDLLRGEPPRLHRLLQVVDRSLDGGPGVYILQGDPGDDTLTGPPNDSSVDTLNGGAGNDICLGPFPDGDSLTDCNP